MAVIEFLEQVAKHAHHGQEIKNFIEQQNTLIRKAYKDGSISLLLPSLNHKRYLAHETTLASR